MMRWINEEDLIAYDEFSTSIYDMHTDDEDCCAMAGCGFCLQQKIIIFIIVMKLVILPDRFGKVFYYMDYQL